MSSRVDLRLWVIGAILAIACLIQGSSSAVSRCHICNSENDAWCKEVPNDREPSNCADWCQQQNGIHIPPSYVAPTGHEMNTTRCPKFNSCRKSVFRISGAANPHDNNDVTRIVRACGFLGDESQQKHNRRAQGGGLQSEIAVCFDKDGCNIAMSTIKQISVLVATVVAVVAYCI
ncbi:hypothetical protein RvY_10721 [Ramazzottius varieornatus]|uniref:Protein quiver n=1 Tax=Ramazzottius varieornatus TaxID=947166 RepID=A0A1D1VDQ3_RAMVA|nr:hypothetical protein RvY_10721 [Ramazzottius varieornatus]